MEPSATQHGDGDETHKADRSNLCCCTFQFTKEEVFKEVKKILLLAWPTSAYLLLNYGLNLAPVIFNGRLGKTELAAASLSVAVLGATVRAVGIGFTTACETYFAQTYGSENKKQVGIELQKSILCVITVMVLTLVVCLNAETILVFLGQEPKISALVGTFLTLYLPGIPAEMLSMVLVKYLQCQSILLPIVAILLVTNLINIGLHYLFMFVFGMGLKGAPVALMITMYVLVFFLIAYIFLKGIYKTTWSGWSRECLVGWGKFYKLGVAGLLMVCFEWWSFEIGLIIAGLLGEDVVGVQSIALHLISFAYMVPLGISIAASIRVGNKLGANQPRDAILACHSALLVCWTFAAAEALFFTALKRHLGYLFISDQDIVKQASYVIQIFAALVFFDNAACCFSGVVRGTGHQVLGAGINFIGFYIIGLPLSMSLMFFTNLQVMGYWLGQTFALFTQSIMFAVLVYNFNWPKEAKRALKKAGIVETLISPEYEEEGDRGVRSATDAAAHLGLMKNKESQEDGTAVKAEEECNIPLAEKQNQFAATPEYPTEEEVVSKKGSFRYILLKRLLLMAFCSCVLAVGIFCRLLVVHDGAFIYQANDTSVYDELATVKYGI